MLSIAVHWHLNLYPSPVHHEEEAPPPRHQLPVAHPLLSEPGPFLLFHLWSPQREIGLQGHSPAGHLCAAAHPQWDPAGHVQQDPPDRFIAHRWFQRCPIALLIPATVSSSSQPPTVSWSLDWCYWVFWKPSWSRASWTKIKCCRGNSGSRSRRRSTVTRSRQVSLHSWLSTNRSFTSAFQCACDFRKGKEDIMLVHLQCFREWQTERRAV